ncbi:MAG: glutamine amidotransferase-related protein, partial [Promethearchaeota archaeon]
MKYLTIIDNFDKENDKFHQRFDSVLESQNSRLKWDYIHYSSLSNPDIYAKALKSDGILLTGSYNHVSNPETLKKYYHEQRLIKEFIDPILGICFGHQLIGVTYGFRSGRMDHPDGDIEEEKTLHLHISPKFLLFPRD